MLNRRKLVQIALSEIPSETEFLDYKKEIHISSESGRGKLIRIICAMNNSNPYGKSFIFVGIDDDKNQSGTNFLDDANFQNAINGYIKNCPKVTYENIEFPGLKSNTYIGLITIYPNDIGSEILKKIWKLKVGDKFFRRGSTTDKGLITNNKSLLQNQHESTEMIQRASVSLELTLDNVLTFYNEMSKSYHPRHYVFKDLYVVAISGWDNGDGNLWSEVTIKLLNEEVTFFWSAMEYVKIYKREESLLIEEQAMFFWNNKRQFMPKKRTSVDFSNLGSYSIKQHNFYDIPNLTDSEISKFLNEYPLKLSDDYHYLEIFPYELLLAALNGSIEAANLLLDRNGGKVDGSVAQSYRDAINFYNQALNDHVFS